MTSSSQDFALTVTVDGTAYTVRAGELNSRDITNLRRETGFSFRGLMDAAAKDPDIDIVAAIVWLARRKAGELLLSFEMVASEIGYDSEIELVDEPGEGPDV